MKNFTIILWKIYMKINLIGAERINTQFLESITQIISQKHAFVLFKYAFNFVYRCFVLIFLWKIINQWFIIFLKNYLDNKKVENLLDGLKKKKKYLEFVDHENFLRKRKITSKIPKEQNEILDRAKILLKKCEIDEIDESNYELKSNNKKYSISLFPLWCCDCIDYYSKGLMCIHIYTCILLYLSNKSVDFSNMDYLSIIQESLKKSQNNDLSDEKLPMFNCM